MMMLPVQLLVAVCYFLLMALMVLARLLWFRTSSRLQLAVYP